MSLVSEIITQDQIQDLWGCGFTIVARNRHPDPFYVSPEMVPQGRSYQWWHLVHDKFHFERPKDAMSSGWAPVPASRHDGYFMPFGHTGDIEVYGLGLFEKSKVEVDAERAQSKAAALKHVDDWMKETGAEFSGHFAVGEAITDVGERSLFVVPQTKTLETTTKVPKDMFDRMADIFEERDRLKAELLTPDRFLKPGEIADKFYAAIEEDQSLPWWPTLHAILLPIAIENVRRKTKSQESGS
jgi:hypothetical protein